MRSLVGAVEMTAPVSDDAIAAVRSIALAPIAHDGVIRNAGRDRNLVDRHDETIVWRQRVDAVRKALQLQGRGIGRQPASRMVLPMVSNLTGVFTSIEPMRPSQFLARSLPRCGVDMKMTRPISGRCLKMSACSRRRLLSAGISVCSGGFPKACDPEFRPGVGDQSSGDASTHAVPHHHHRFAERISLFDGVEFLAEDERAIGIGITAGITVKPKLIVGPDILVARANRLALAPMWPACPSGHG